MQCRRWWWGQCTLAGGSGAINCRCVAAQLCFDDIYFFASLLKSDRVRVIKQLGGGLVRWGAPYEIIAGYHRSRDRPIGKVRRDWLAGGGGGVPL